MLNQRDIRSTQMTARAVESADQSIMFTIVKYFRHSWTPLFSVIAYPVQFLSSAMQALTAWQEACIAKSDNPDKNNLIIKAMVYLVSTLALGVSIIGIFAAYLGSLIVAPALMCAGYALKSLYHLCSAIYNTIKFYNAKTDIARDGYKEKAKDDLALGIAGALVSIALGICLFLHKASFGIMGIVGGFVGTVYCVIKQNSCVPKRIMMENREGLDRSMEPDAARLPSHSLSNTSLISAKIKRRLGSKIEAPSSDIVLVSQPSAYTLAQITRVSTPIAEVAPNEMATSTSLTYNLDEFLGKTSELETCPLEEFLGSRSPRR